MFSCCFASLSWRSTSASPSLERRYSFTCISGLEDYRYSLHHAILMHIPSAARNACASQLWTVGLPATCRAEMRNAPMEWRSYTLMAAMSCP